MARIIFLKSEQFSLFDTPVNVRPTVRKDGTVVKPHTRIQKKRLEQPAASKPAPLLEHKPAEKPALVEYTTRTKGRTLRGLIFHGSKEQAQSLDPYTFAHDGGWFIREKYLADGKLPSARAVESKPAAPQVPVSASLGSDPGADSSIGDRLESATSGVLHPAAAAGIDYSVPFDAIAVPAFGVSAGISKAERRAINQRCSDLLDAKESGFTAEDKALLRQYSGNGGCGDSLNEFYTEPTVAAAIWKALRWLGVDGEVLEPSCGTGVFLATAPAGAHVTGVEMDPVSSRISTILHGGTVNASLERFANDSGGRQYDAVIGNAPFGLRGSLLKDDKPEMKTAEAYFFDTALDMTRPGGIVAMIVPTGLLDSRRDRSVRERLLCKGEFLGAQRMPNTAFEHSHTEVTSDVVFFRKRPDDVAAALQVLPQEKLREFVWDEEYLAGEYFTGRGAGNVLGTMEAGWRAKAGMGEDITVTGSMAGVPEAIAGFTPDAVAPGGVVDVPAILAAVAGDDALQKRIRGAALKRPYERSKPGETKVVDGVTYVLQGEPLRWHRIDEFLETDEVKDAQPLAAEIERAMSGQAYDRKALEAGVRAYIAKHGVPVKNDNLQLAAKSDKTLHRLIGAVRPDGSLSDVVTGAVDAPKRETSMEAAAEALAAQQGVFTADELATRWNMEEREATLDQLYASDAFALTPEGMWTTKDKFLSGELWPKLDAVRARLADKALSQSDRFKLEREAKVIEETIDPRVLDDVECMINSAWIPTDVVAAFFTHKLDEYKKEAGNSDYAKGLQPMKLSFDKGIYTASGGMWGESDKLEKYLNRTGIRKDDLPKIEEWNKEFKEWLCASSYRDAIEDLYNRKFRGFRQEAFSDEPFNIPGLANLGEIKNYQWPGLRWALAAGKGIIAADVGLGKTLRGLMLARMARLSGQAKQPWIVVPKTVLANWDAEIAKWFPGEDRPANAQELAERIAPGMRVLVIGETYSRDKAGKLKSRVDSPTERNRKFHDASQNDYDLVLISQPAFNDLDLDPIKKGEYINDDFWVQRGDALGNAGDKRTNKIREAYNQAIAQREFQKRSDAIYFNQTRCDMLIGDEFHAYKNLYAAKNRFGQQPKFLGGQGLSNRALDMNLKCRWIRENNGGRNVYGLTATPTKNSPLEVYSMLSHIAPEAFERIGIRNSEEFLDRFCKFVNAKTLSTTGEIEDALITAGFKNMGELREIMKRYIDRTTAEQVGLKLPAKDQRMHLVDMTQKQQQVYATLRELAAKAKGKDATGDAHIFSIMDKMGKAAMDLELLDGAAYAGQRSPKYEAAAKEIAAGAKEGGQIVFAESVHVHPKMVEALVKKGIARERIAIMNAQEAEDSAKRQNISDAFNEGRLDVVIGNSVMSEGVNLQKRTTDIHDLDLPWNPASLQQRHGRGVRQGNVNEAVRLHSYLAKGSFDGYRYQCILAKKDWQDLLWNGGDEIENLAREGAVSREEMMIMLAADPDAARKKYEGDKAAALVRYESGERSGAAAQFVKFQTMRRSLSGLRDKKSVSATRLKVKFDRLREHLKGNQYFSAKWALDAKDDVLIHPASGIAMTKGHGIDLDGGADGGSPYKGRWVVTAANSDTGQVAMRRYGEVGEGAAQLVKLADINVGVKPFEYKEADETEEVSRKMESMAAEKVNSVTSPKDLVGLSDATVAKVYPHVQAQLKAALRDYKWGPHGAVGMLDANGNAVAHESYEAREHLDTHDLMLPTAEHKQKALTAYTVDERAKTFTHAYHTKRRGGKTETQFVQRYPGKYDARHNRWLDVGRGLFGEGFDDEAKTAFEREQGERVRHAKTFTEALKEAAPMANVDYSQVPHWPKRTLATLFARAKRQGVLGEPITAQQPKLPKELFSYKDGTQTASALNGDWVGHSHAPAKVRDALVKLAVGNGHYDLAAAMIASSSADADTTLKEIGALKRFDNPAVLDAISHVLAKHPELASKPAESYLDKYWLSSLLKRIEPDMTVGEAVKELRGLLPGGEEREAA